MADISTITLPNSITYNLKDASVGSGILTLQQNGSTIGTFSANSVSNTTINITSNYCMQVIDGIGYFYAGEIEQQTPITLTYDVVHVFS